MRALTRPLLLGALALGSFLATAPASAENCVGDSTIFYVCVTTPTVTPGETTRCVYAGGSTCEEVSAPWVYVSGGFDHRCGGSLRLAACELIGLG